MNERFKIEIDAIAVVGDDQPVEREFIDPAEGFTQVVTTRGTGQKVIQVSGQVGRPGDSLEQQPDQVYGNLRKRLKAALRLARDGDSFGDSWPFSPASRVAANRCDLLKTMAEGLGFEPRVPFWYNGFQDRRLQPLGHPSETQFWVLGTKTYRPRTIRTLSQLPPARS